MLCHGKYKLGTNVLSRFSTLAHFRMGIVSTTCICRVDIISAHIMVMFPGCCLCLVPYRLCATVVPSLTHSCYHSRPASKRRAKRGASPPSGKKRKRRPRPDSDDDELMETGGTVADDEALALHLLTG